MTETKDTTVADYFRQDPDGAVAAFKEWNSGFDPAGFAPAGIVLNASGNMVLASGTRELFVIVSSSGGGEFGMHICDDALDAIDPTAVSEEPYSSHASVREAFMAACEEIGCEIKVDFSTAPAP